MSLPHRLLISVLALAACGDDGGSATPDASTGTADARPDGMVDECDYQEMADATNDDTAGGTAEASGVTASTESFICGAFDHTHFDGDITVDVDSYTFDVTAEGDFLVRIVGAAQNIELVGVDIYTGANLDQLVGANTFYGSHGVTSVHLTPGTYALTAFALNSEAIINSVPYKLQVVADSPDTRCMEVTAGGYAEAADGANDDSNDVIRLASGMPPALTTSTADNPEPTNIVLAANQDIRISGEAADIAAPDLYEDKDTYLIATALGTNEIAVRLTWPGTTANLDYILFEANNPQPVMRANATSTTGPEYETFSVKPSASYWLLVGARAGSTVPVTYNATLCGATFTP